MHWGVLISGNLAKWTSGHDMDPEWRSLPRWDEDLWDEKWEGEEVREAARARVDSILAFMKQNKDTLNRDLTLGERLKLYKRYKACEGLRSILIAARSPHQILKSTQPWAVSLLESALNDRDNRFNWVFFSSDGDKRYFQRLDKWGTTKDLVNGLWEDTKTLTSKQLEDVKRLWHRNGWEFVVREYREGPIGHDPVPGKYRVCANGIELPE